MPGSFDAVVFDFFICYPVPFSCTYNISRGLTNTHSILLILEESIKMTAHKAKPVIGNLFHPDRDYEREKRARVAGRWKRVHARERKRKRTILFNLPG